MPVYLAHHRFTLCKTLPQRGDNLSNVNADSAQLITLLKNLQTSISSIETAKNSVKMKYEQLGIGWKDKKYVELGMIVRDCNKALNEILQIML